MGRDNVVGYCDSLWAGRSGDRNQVEAKFFVPVQDGPGARPAFCTMCTILYTKLKWQGRGVNRSTPSSAKVIERVEPYLYSPSGPSWPILGEIYFALGPSN